MAQIVMHGTLHATIYEVHKLHSGPGKVFRKLMGSIEEAVGLGKGMIKLYATIDLEKARVGHTRMVHNKPSNRRWCESFHIYCAHTASNVAFTIKVENPIGATVEGRAYVPVSDILEGDELFHSIDGGAAFGFQETPKDAARAGLMTSKDNIIDRSIQDSYINAIRQAENFIYIKNKYFLGSSFNWAPNGIEPEDINALHLIPKEMSLKIVSKIEAGERFSVYIVVPMWPEGVPESGSIQAILNWQRLTMDMMCKDIVQALRAKGIEEDPWNYLTHFCLGNGEVKESSDYEPPKKPEPDADYKKAQQNGRFMTHIHASRHEYMIIGSANINRRSMDGTRDSEIAKGAYQPHQLSLHEPARGQIHGVSYGLMVRAPWDARDGEPESPKVLGPVLERESRARPARSPSQLPVCSA